MLSDEAQFIIMIKYKRYFALGSAIVAVAGLALSAQASPSSVQGGFAVSGRSSAIINLPNSGSGTTTAPTPKAKPGEPVPGEEVYWEQDDPKVNPNHGSVSATTTAQVLKDAAKKKTADLKAASAVYAAAQKAAQAKYQAALKVIQAQRTADLKAAADAYAAAKKAVNDAYASLVQNTTRSNVQRN